MCTYFTRGNNSAIEKITETINNTNPTAKEHILRIFLRTNKKKHGNNFAIFARFVVQINYFLSRVCTRAVPVCRNDSRYIKSRRALHTRSVRAQIILSRAYAGGTEGSSRALIYPSIISTVRGSLRRRDSDGESESNVRRFYENLFNFSENRELLG